MVERTAASIRADIGTSREHIAEWAGVSIPTVILFEASPTEGVRTRSKRAACARVYQILSNALAKLERVKEIDRVAAPDREPAPADRRRRSRRPDHPA
jgi:hypothetical protein